MSCFFSFRQNFVNTSSNITYIPFLVSANVMQNSLFDDYSCQFYKASQHYYDFQSSSKWQFFSSCLINWTVSLQIGNFKGIISCLQLQSLSYTIYFLLNDLCFRLFCLQKSTIDSLISYFKLQYTTTAAASRVPFELGVNSFILINFSLNGLIYYNCDWLPYLFKNYLMCPFNFLSISSCLLFIEFVSYAFGTN